MSQTDYWIVSMCLGGGALVVSLLSFALSWKNRIDQQTATRLSKKTELLTRWVEVKATFNHLAMVYAQKLLLIRQIGGEGYEHEAARISNNLELVREQSRNADSQYNTLRNQYPKDMSAWEDMLLTANSFLADSTKQLEKEQEAFSELRESLG